MSRHQPPFPVVDPDPTVNKCLNSLRFSDYALISGVSAGSWAFGYIGGKPVRAATAGTTLGLGLLFGVIYTSQSALYRMMGYSENSREVKKYGLYPLQPSEADYVGKPRGSSYYKQPKSWTTQ
mmetsp:Transcript_4026/g.5468  ORF Transcript_4026/g.5468 Transcript_4026/m.5468 type:complete len:123 (+) Transcript_4026:36-404(+)|eukprot:CAMPEP_0116055170 /NCGR_PEP_ID=MMETSP0322-20121206/3243_1 /TAXON_ID=163516 /ORGANISM="Leptocylindrus danicus var. apora, Strain B651" /LENGTH=122 /DNA_ID=CAMNT_0003538713 /DNA_START=31 /DNA_END=399 /DNA_ORIENTATION=+